MDMFWRTIFAAFVLVSIGRLAPAPAQAEEDAATPKTVTEDANNDSAAAPAEKKVDTNPHLVADGKPAEMLEAIRELRTKQKQLAGVPRDERTDVFVQIQEAIIDAADRILKNTEVDEELAARALAEKFVSLGYEKQLRQSNAATRLSAAIQERLSDARGKVAAEARLAETKLHLESIAKLSPRQRETMTAEVVGYLKSHEPTQETLGIGMDIARQVERVDTQLAARTYRDIAAIFAKSDDADLRESATKMEGSARRLELPGNFLELDGTTVDGKPFDWSSYRGKVVLVDYWATWCGPCIAELPNVKKNYERYHDRGFEVVGISLDTDRNRLEEFIKQEQLPWITLFSDDPKATGWDHPMATHYGVMAIPTVLLVDQQGKVVNLRARGPALEEELTKLLGPAKDDSASSKATETAKQDKP